MFRTEYRKFCSLYHLDGQMGAPDMPADRATCTWSAVTQGRDWRVETTYEFLRWEDIIRRDFEQPLWQPILASLREISRGLLDGGLFRIYRAHWRFGLFVLYPYVLLAFWTLLAAAGGVFAARLAGDATAITAIPELLGLAVAALIFVTAVKATEPATYMLYLFRDAVATCQYARRGRPDWDERLDTFAGYVVEAAQTATADEIVIVGHSSGSFIAVDALTRALARDPKLGQHGPRIVLLTIGANLPIVGFQPAASWFRERLARLAVDPSVDWDDYQSRRDIMNFFPFDPIAGHGIDLKDERFNPHVVPVQFRNIVTPERFTWLQWRFFTLHFQFLRANERPAAYDYFMIVAGPFWQALRVAMPDDVTAAVAGDDAAVRIAWDRLRARTDADVAQRTADASIDRAA